MTTNNQITVFTVAFTVLKATSPGLRQHININELTWCAVVFTKTLIDYLVNSPNREALAPFGSAASFVEIKIETGAMQ
ncbi:MAG: hypothetical protein COA78_24225 [Blastopirellula sp.]|nr:MAG: hypothetical protein COA78_24225 [Blastopirellula sp.]